MGKGDVTQLCTDRWPLINFVESLSHGSVGLCQMLFPEFTE
jgi:hypothetical protein